MRHSWHNKTSGMGMGKEGDSTQYKTEKQNHKLEEKTKEKERKKIIYCI